MCPGSRRRHDLIAARRCKWIALPFKLCLRAAAGRRRGDRCPGCGRTLACAGGRTAAARFASCRTPTGSRLRLGRAEPPSRPQAERYWPPSFGPACQWMLWQRSWLLDVDSSLQFRTGPAGGGGEEGPPPTDFLTLFPLSPPYFTPWQLPHLLLPPASLREAKLC